MAGKGTIGIAAAAALAVVAVALGGVALAAQDDPRVSVAPVDLGPLAVAGSVRPGDAPASGGQQVAALDSLEGTLEQRGDDADDFSLGAVDLEFGHEGSVLTAGVLEDYDRDGTPEKLLAELDGLVGQPITALVRLDDDGDEADVYELNGLTYRDSAGGPVSRQPIGRRPGNIASPQEIADAAAAAVGPGASVVELDSAEEAGDVAWEAEVIARDGQEHDVLLNATGQVIDARPDD